MKILGAHWFQRKDEASFQGNRGLQRNPWSWPRDWSTAEKWDRMDRPPVAQNCRRHNTSQTNWTSPPSPQNHASTLFLWWPKWGEGGTLTLGATIYAFLRVQFVKHIVLTPPINLSYCDRFSSFWTKELLRHGFRCFPFCLFLPWVRSGRF